jgi:nitroreductase
MISELRKKIHIIEKEKLENLFNEKKIDDAKNLYIKVKNNLSNDEISWVEEVLFNADRKKINLDNLDKFKDAIYNRRSVRKWSNEDILIKHIKEIINSARYAPSSCNRQPLEFIYVSDREKIKILSEIKRQKFISGAIGCIIVLVNMNVYKKQDLYFPCLDAGAAIQNMLLTIHYLGLGGCWVNTSDNETDNNKIKNVFNIPNNFLIGSFVVLGYPAHIPILPGRKDVEMRLDKYE